MREKFGAVSGAADGVSGHARERALLMLASLMFLFLLAGSVVLLLQA